ncbi:MAG: MEKHLA domain-containing protein [Gallionellaceae bacterium]|nr:MEKHLA domain-containing protein [Gallionellaceae bacterium]
MIPEPAATNDYLPAHAALLINSYRLWTGKALLDSELPPREAARALYHAPFVVLSHDSTPDPRFTYANLAAQERFEMAWREIVGLPSRLSAESMARPARAQLLETVASQGYIDSYSGVRIAKSGRRFMIRNATVWNLSDADGQFQGQAAMFSDYQDIAAPESR